MVLDEAVFISRRFFRFGTRGGNAQYDHVQALLTTQRRENPGALVGRPFAVQKGMPRTMRPGTVVRLELNIAHSPIEERRSTTHIIEAFAMGPARNIV